MLQNHKAMVVAVTLAAIVIGILLIEAARADEPLPASPCVISGSGLAVTTAAGCLVPGNPDYDVRRDAGADARDGGPDGGPDAQDGRRGPGKSNTRGGGRAKGKGGSQGHGDQGKGHE